MSNSVPQRKAAQPAKRRAARTSGQSEHHAIAARAEHPDGLTLVADGKALKDAERIAELACVPLEKVLDYFLAFFRDDINQHALNEGGRLGDFIEDYAYQDAETAQRALENLQRLKRKEHCVFIEKTLPTLTRLYGDSPLDDPDWELYQDPKNGAYWLLKDPMCDDTRTLRPISTPKLRELLCSSFPPVLAALLE